MPPEYRFLPPQDVPKDVLKTAQALLENALRSIFQRLVVPMVPEGQLEIRVIPYYPYLYKRFSTIDPQVKIYPSGGVVRSALGYLYAQIYASEEQDTAAILRSIADSTEPIPAYQIRGVNSDFDSWVISNRFQEVKSSMLQITNSAEEQYGMRESNDLAKRTFFTIKDVKEYYAQTERSTRQGGSWVDFLAFDPQTGHFVEPQSHPGIVQKFLLGQNRYLPAQQDQHPEDAHKQTIRGIRPLLELPWLVYDSTSESVLRNELAVLKKAIQRTGQVDRKGIDQFRKAIRNARFSGAHNRLYRHKPGSLDAQIFDVFSSISQQLKHPAFPEFVDHFPVNHRGKRRTELNGISPKTLFPVRKFITDFTDHGTIYHGTPEFSQALAIMRGGLFISRQGQGRAREGRGAYATKNKSLAQSHADRHQNGMVLELVIKPDDRLNILVWDESASQDPIIHRLIHKHRGNLDLIFEELARNHGIDLIINTHILIENTAALDLSASLEIILKSLWHNATNPELDIVKRIVAYTTFKKYSAYAVHLGIDINSQFDLEDLTSICSKEFHDVSDERLNHEFSWEKLELTSELDSIFKLFLDELSLVDPLLAVRIYKILIFDNKCPVEVRFDYFARLRASQINTSLLKEAGYSEKKAINAFTDLLIMDKANPGVNRQAARIFRKHGIAPNIARLTKPLSSGDTGTQIFVAETLGLIGPHAKAAVSDVANLLDSNDPFVRREACKALKEIGFDDPRTVRKVTTLLTDDEGSCGEVRYAAEDALKKTQLPPDKRVLVRILRSNRSTERQKYLAIEWLGKLKEHSVVPDLRTQLTSPSWGMRLVTAKALGEIGFEDPDTIRKLTKLLVDDQGSCGNVRETAKEAFDKTESTPDRRVLTRVVQSTCSTKHQKQLAQWWLEQLRGNTGDGHRGFHPHISLKSLTAMRCAP